MHTITDVLEFARLSATQAVDQTKAFGTLDDSIYAHYENVVDTLYEHRRSLVRGIKWNFGQILMLANSTYEKAVDDLLNDQHN